MTAIALRALLAHEHGHPLAENETVQAARELSVEVAAEGRDLDGGDRRSTRPLGRRLCVHSPQEVFATRWQFGPVLPKPYSTSTRTQWTRPARVSSRRASFMHRLEQPNVRDGKLSMDEVGGALLFADLPAPCGDLRSRRRPSCVADTARQARSPRGRPDRRRAVPSRSGGAAL